MVGGRGERVVRVFKMGTLPGPRKRGHVGRSLIVRTRFPGVLRAGGLRDDHPESCDPRPSEVSSPTTPTSCSGSVFRHEYVREGPADGKNPDGS